MSTRCFASVLAAVLLVTFVTSARADSVIVNGETFTCTNTCVVTLLGGNRVNVHDCCGGTVTWKMK